MLESTTKGFTLIELLVVIAIISILCAIGISLFFGFQEKAKVATTQENCSNTWSYVVQTNYKCSSASTIKLMSKIRDTNFYNISCSINKFSLFGDYLINHIDNHGRNKNPYKVDGNRVQQPGRCNASYSDGNVGFVWIWAESSEVSMCGCIRTPCSNPSNRCYESLSLDF